MNTATMTPEQVVLLEQSIQDSILKWSKLHNRYKKGSANALVSASMADKYREMLDQLYESVSN